MPRKKKRSKCLRLSSLSLQALQNWAARERWAAKMSSRSPHMAFYQSNYLILFCSIKNWFFIKLSYLTCSQKVLLCLTFNEVLSSFYSHGSDFSTLRRHIFVHVFAISQLLNRIMKKNIAFLDSILTFCGIPQYAKVYSLTLSKSQKVRFCQLLNPKKINEFLFTLVREKPEPCGGRYCPKKFAVCLRDNRVLYNLFGFWSFSLFFREL